MFHGDIYLMVEELSRDIFFYLSENLGLGMGLTICAISIGIKLVYMPFIIGTQLNALKKRLLEPEMKHYQSQLVHL